MENVLGFLPGQGAVFQQTFEGLPLHKVHDDVGRGILLEHLPHLDHAGDVLQLRHLPGLLQEQLHALLPGGYRLLGLRPHQGPGAGHTADLTGGIVLLDGNLSLQSHVETQVGDAEAPLAQHLAHQKLAAQNDTRLQDKRTLLLPRRVIAALRAGVAPEIGHTAHTSIHFHPLHPLSTSDCRNNCSIKAKARQGKFKKSRLPLSSGLGEYVTRCPVMLSPTRDSIRGRLGATSYFISF